MTDRNYCWNMKGNRTDSRLDVLVRILRRNRLNRSSIRELCDVELIEHLLFDAEMTNGVESWWRQNLESKKLSESVLSIFVGTQSGLTRYWKPGNRTTDFPAAKTTSLTEMYYTMAVDNGQDVVTVSSPLKPVSPGYQVTMSSPVVVTSDNLTAVVAVVGVQLKHEFFKAVFKSISVPCDGRNQTNCSFSCNSNVIDCYLLDANGYVLLSNNDNEVGRFFGEIDSTVMIRLQDEKDNPRVIYKSVVFYDYQDVCLLYDKESSSSPAPTNTGFLRQLLDFLISRFSFVIQTICQLTLVDWSMKSVLLYLFRPPLHTEAAAAADDARSPEPFMCDRALNLVFVPRLSNTTAPSGKAEINDCPGNCKKSLAFSHVPQTNLFLVVSDSKCSCAKDAPILREQKATSYNDSTICEKLREISHRMRPEYCFSSHPLEKQGSCEASDDHCLSKMLVTVLSAISLLRPLY